MKECPHCGEQVSDDEVMCPYCKSDLGPMSATAPERFED